MFFPFQLLPDGQRFPRQGGNVDCWFGGREIGTRNRKRCAQWQPQHGLYFVRNVNKFTGIRIEGSNCLCRPTTSRRVVSLPPIFNTPKSLAPGLSPPLRPRAGSTLWRADVFSSPNELTLTHLSTIYINVVVHYSMPLRFLPKFRFWH